MIVSLTNQRAARHCRQSLIIHIWYFGAKLKKNFVSASFFLKLFFKVMKRY